LRDEAAIPVLETFASAAKETPTRTPAEYAISAIRSGRPPANESQSLRSEVMELKKQNRELQDEMKALNKKVDAVAKATPDDSKQTTKSRKPQKRGK
jgi:uncharacterized protein YlxW (UPF0749 family)